MAEWKLPKFNSNNAAYNILIMFGFKGPTTQIYYLETDVMI